MDTLEWNSTAQQKKSGNSNSSHGDSNSNRHGGMKNWGYWGLMLSVSVTGGMVLGWWEYEYHPNYRQLWMVPFGLVLLITPLVAWLSLIVSDLCNLNEDKYEDEDWKEGKIKDPSLQSGV